MSTAVPAQLGGRYEIGELLGRGGMAEVHLGRDTRLARTVAIKLLRADLARDPSFQTRFRREAHSAASLNHPAIVAVYDTGEDELNGRPVPYIVMEYVEGSTLRDLMASGSRLTPERAMEVVDGILAALAYSHEQGIVHRDIKPANVMLTPSGEIKVMDFGIARAVADVGATMTQTSTVIGTAQYLSPEQARGEQVDARSDLYSTGCVLYELLTGRPPFIGESPVSVAYQHVREHPVAPSMLDPDVPPSVDAIVMKALTKDRNARYQSAQEMRADIAAALAGRPVSAAAAGAATMAMAPTPAYDHTTVLPATSTFPAGDRGGEPERKGGRALGYVLLGLAVVAVFVIAALLGRELLGGGGVGSATVPDLQGLTVAQARAELRQEGLKLGAIEREPSDTVPKGAIKDQSPESGQSIDEGGKVDVVVSTGREMTTVPPLVGLTLDQAVQALKDAKLQPGATDPVPSKKAEGTVTKVTPGEGEALPIGTPVDIRYASGENKVPDVSGLTETEARSKLENAGFVVATTNAESADQPAGTVIAQTPTAGGTARLGSTVTITVATAPATPTPTPTPTPTDTATPIVP